MNKHMYVFSPTAYTTEKRTKGNNREFEISAHEHSLLLNLVYVHTHMYMCRSSLRCM